MDRPYADREMSHAVWDAIAGPLGLRYHRLEPALGFGG